MKWLIITVVMISLIGSVMWVMPSPRQRYQAELRMRARKMGVQVQLSRVDLPRAKGEVEPETISVPAYRFPRTNLERSERDRWVVWQVHRVETLENEGLPAGWSWLKGAGELSESVRLRVNELLQSLPEDVVGVESTPLYLGLFWYERGEPERLEQLNELVQPLLDDKL